MKKFFRKLYICMKGIAYARAASELSRNGRYKEAQELMRQYGECK